MELVKIKGIPIRIHWSFVLIMIYVAYTNYAAGRDIYGIFWALVYLLTLFLCVTLHELGHALAALRFGLKTKSITLYPIGGVAALEKIPEKPIQELIVALAGPLVNIVISLFLWLWIFFSPFEYHLEDIGIQITPQNILINLAAVNLILAFFNLLPAFPMDGGRVLRALLSIFMDRVQATKIAMFAGQAMSILFIFWGFHSNPFLILIGLFVFYGALQEYQLVKTTNFLKKKFVKDALITDFTVLYTYHTLEDVKNIILRGHEKEFIVVDTWGKFIGILTREILLEKIATVGLHLSVEDCYQKSQLAFTLYDDLNEAFHKMHAYGVSIAPIMENHSICGVITLENIMECMLFGEALNQRLSNNL